MTKAKLTEGRNASKGRAGSFFAMLLALAVGAAAVPALAQAPSFSFGSRSYVTPFPQSDRYQVHVIGDGLAEGLSNGMQAAFEKDGTVKIVNSSKWSNGLIRSGDRPDIVTETEALAKSQGMNVAVAMLGMNDIRNIRNNEGALRAGTPPWRDAYGKEIDRLLKMLKDNNVAVYWVGLPIMSSAKTNESMGMLNDIFRERTYVAGVKFIDTWNGFTDQFGAFASYGPDITGQTKRLREADGTYFTAQGNRKLANYVEVLLRRDLAAAKAERNIPLAGDDEEQGRLVPKAGAESASAETPGAEETPAPGSPTATPGPDQPPRPAPVQQLQVPRQLSFRPGDAPQGETIVGDISNGVTALATVSTLNDLNANLGEKRLPTQERLYYKTLIKGQALKPKPGRADDFKWPRS
jgi:hypothetical protein